MKKALVIGTGAGGATVAKELQGKFAVTVLEAGQPFRPFALNLSLVEQIKKTGLLFDEREIQLLFPVMKIRKTPDRMVMVNGIGLGGTTTLATGNGIRLDHDLQKYGINLDAEFAELYREIPISTDHQKRWRQSTRRLYKICYEMNLNPTPLPKMGDNRKCINCGRCVLGCAYCAKWDSRSYLQSAVEKGATVLTGRRVSQVVIKGSMAVGVKASRGWRTEFHAADLVVLAAGGFGTPEILENSGIASEKRLFIDPVLCVAAEWRGANQDQELSMPFVVEKDGYILAPYFDYLSFFFNNDWRLPANDILSIMIKLADSCSGTITKGKIIKTLTDQDQERLKTAVVVCQEIFGRLGIAADQTFLGTINAGHPGGMMPLTEQEAETFHHRQLPENLYLADSSLFPSSLGKPPILTIMAMAKRVAKICAQL